MVVTLVLALLTAPPSRTPYFPPPIPMPPQPPVETPLLAGQPNILYLNFDGAQMRSTGSCDNAPANCSYIAGNVSYPAFNGSAFQKMEIIRLVTLYYQPFNIQIVTQRPASGNYSMVMIGGTSLVGQGAAGVAPLDCGDTNPNNVSFAFSEEVNNQPYDVATTIAQESAHAYGLGHTDNPQDLMYPALSGQEMSFLDLNMRICDIVSGWPQQCGTQSDCTGTGRQNSHQLLLANVGPGDTGPDTQPPTISFISPNDGDTVPSGFLIQFSATDNRGVVTVDLSLDGHVIGSAGAAPWNFQIPGGVIPAGMHKFKGTAKDMAGNAGDSTEISLTVKALGETPGDLGSACNTDADCPGGLCAFDSGANRHFCTRICDAASSPCPTGFACVDAGGPKVCATDNSMGGHHGGGCSTVPSERSALAGALLLGLGVFALVLARRRP